EVWKSIADFDMALGTASATGALDDVYTGTAEAMASWLGHFPCTSGQLGLLAFLGSQPIGMDVIGSDKLYQRLHDRLLRGYVMDALAVRGAKGSISAALAQAFLHRVGAAGRVAAQTAGAG